MSSRHNWHMKIEMCPHSGVVAWDFLDRPFPVVGWYTSEVESGGMKLCPLVLDNGQIVPIDDKAVYSLVGLTQPWFDLVAQHNARPYGMERAG